MGHEFHSNLLRIGLRATKSCFVQSITAIVETSHARLSSFTLKYRLCSNRVPVQPGEET